MPVYAVQEKINYKMVDTVLATNVKENDLGVKISVDTNVS